MRFSKNYYTRYHIWQNLVAAMGDNMPAPDTMFELASKGLEFVWQDGSDVFEEEEEKEGTQLSIVDSDYHPSGSYL